jgi:hypothetical protein
MKKYEIRAKFITIVDFPIIEATNKRDAIEKAELLLLTDKNLEESEDDLPIWEIDNFIDH